MCRKLHIQNETDGQRAARWNVEREGRETDWSAFRYCKPVHIRRLARRAPSSMAIYVATVRNHYTCHRGWSTHLARERYRKAQPNQLAIRISRNIRRPRQVREASTEQASLEWHQSTSHQQNHPREGTAALPYAENLASAAQAIFVTTTHHIRADTAVRPYAEFVS